MNSPHLTAEELDAFLAQSSPESVTSHVATCPVCAGLVEHDRQLVAALTALPQFRLGPDFSDQVMARVTIAAVPALAVAAEVRTPRSIAARRRALGAAILASGGIAAAFVWAGSHSAESLRWSAPAWHGAGHTLWLSLQAVVANATEQPWFASFRDTLATPLRALGAMAGVAAVYAVGLLGLRRLMNEPATNASW